MPGSIRLSNRKTRDVKYFQSRPQRVTRLSVQGVKPLTQGQDQGVGGKKGVKPPADLLKVPPAPGTVTAASPLDGVAGRAAPAAVREGMKRLEGSRGAGRTLEMPGGP